MSIVSRKELKNAFRSGRIPTQQDFYDLLDSYLNLADDFLVNLPPGGVKVFAEQNRHWLEMARSRSKSDASWSLGRQGNLEDASLNIIESQNNGDQCSDRYRMSFRPGGGLGIMQPAPQFTLDVNGTVGMKSRVGMYNHGEFPAVSERNILPEGFRLYAGHYAALEVLALYLPGDCHPERISYLHTTAMAGFTPHTREPNPDQKTGRQQPVPVAAPSSPPAQGENGFRRAESWGFTENLKFQLAWSGSQASPSLILSIPKHPTSGNPGTIRFWVTNLLPHSLSPVK